MESPVSLDPSAISLVPALRDAQKAAKEVASIRREEDVALKKASRRCWPGQAPIGRKIQVEITYQSSASGGQVTPFILLPSPFPMVQLLTYESFTGMVREDEFPPWWGVPPT
jgi:hypothetical protein